MSQPERQSFVYIRIFVETEVLASPSSTSTPNFKLQDYLEVPDRAAQRQPLFSSVLCYER